MEFWLAFGWALQENYADFFDPIRAALADAEAQAEAEAEKLIGNSIGSLRTPDRQE